MPHNATTVEEILELEAFINPYHHKATMDPVTEDLGSEHQQKAEPPHFTLRQNQRRMSQ
ncbi:uncharacterized protein V6R79_017160 [Siganus canaliculatus]